MVGGFLTYHQGRRIEIAVGDLRNDGTVGHAQAIDADDAAFMIDDGGHVLGRAHLAGAAGVIGAFAMLADEGVDLRIGLHIASGLYFTPGVFLHGGLLEQFAGEADAGAELLPVIGMGHVIEQNFGRRLGVAIAHMDMAARLAAHGPHVNLEAVALEGHLAVIAHGGGQEVVFDVGIFNAGLRADEAAGFKVIGGSQAGLERQPFQADHGLGVEVEA